MPIIDMQRTGENIKHLRQQNNLTVRELQDIMGFETPNTIYKWQHGAAMPTIDNLAVLAAVFGTSIDEILVFDMVPMKSGMTA